MGQPTSPAQLHWGYTQLWLDQATVSVRGQAYSEYTFCLSYAAKFVFLFFKCLPCLQGVHL
jgi:hypothetical protein